MCYVLYGRQPAEHPLSPGSWLYVLYGNISQGKPLNIHSPRVPCYMYYMCYISQGKPLNIHSPPALEAIAFLSRKTVQKSYYSRVYIYVRTVVIAFLWCKTALNVHGFGSTLPQLLAICTICAVCSVRAKICTICANRARVPADTSTIAPGSMLYVLYVLYLTRQPTGTVHCPPVGCLAEI